MCLEKKLNMYLMKIQISFAQKKKSDLKMQINFEYIKKSDLKIQILKFKKNNYNK